MAPTPDSFLTRFRERWKEHLRSFPRKYQDGRQLEIGSRFRPLLVSWGYLLSGEVFTQRARDEVVNLALYVELLHKATLLIDDLIDEDDARHGEESFHVQFSDQEAILFAIYLLGDCLERLSISTTKLHCERWYPEIIDLLSKAIKDMSRGAIEEVTSPHKDLASLTRVRQIIELQTIALIKNGLLTGYKYGRGDPSYEDIIDSLGFDCGYLFQVLNDLEPFLDDSLNARNKGATNIDIVRSRKNIAAALTFETLNPSERKLFRELRNSDALSFASRLNKWFLENDILHSVLENLALVKENVHKNIDSLPVEPQRREDFRLFVDHVLRVALKRLGGTAYGKLSRILIR